MEGVREYLIHVTAAALICCAVRQLAGKAVSGNIIGILCGVFLSLAVLAPLRNVKLNGMEHWNADFFAQAQALTAQAQKDSKMQLETVIQNKLEAYILDKAAAMNAVLAVRITLSEDLTPAAIEVKGDISPYARAQLCRYISEELGIGEEQQTWIS